MVLFTFFGGRDNRAATMAGHHPATRTPTGKSAERVTTKVVSSRTYATFGGIDLNHGRARELLKDSRLTTVSDADIHAQFVLDLAVRDRTTAANTGVINIRSCTAQVNDRVAAANDPANSKAGSSLNASLSTVETELYQTKLRAAQDPLNFPIKLNDKIAALHGVIESVDNRPTNQTAQVFDLLSGQLDTQLDDLAASSTTTCPSSTNS